MRKRIAFVAAALTSASFAFAQQASNSTWVPPSSGSATLTHYDLPAGFIAACGCVPEAANYPVAATNLLVYGSDDSYGPACGSCVKLTLVSTPYSPPPNAKGGGGDGIVYTPQQQADGTAPSLVVKLVDSCPGGGWCNATSTAGNILGSKVHFDLAFPSNQGAITDNFFPGPYDYGVWWVNYTYVGCDQWAGYNDPAAQGSDWKQQEWACCPSNPPLPSDPAYGEIIRKSTVKLNADGTVPASEQPGTCPPYPLFLQKDPAVVPLTANILSKNGYNSSSSISSSSSTKTSTSTQSSTSSASSTKSSASTQSSTSSVSSAKSSSTSSASSAKSSTSTQSSSSTKTSSSGTKFSISTNSVASSLASVPSAVVAYLVPPLLAGYKGEL